MTPVELALTKYSLPFTLYDYQDFTVNELAPRPKSGHYLAVGVGKTATSTVATLYKFVTGVADHAIVLLPPILFKTWSRWLDKVGGTNHMLYRGTPAERRRLALGTAQFTLMTYQIFKQDFDQISEAFNHSRTVLICDEATAIKNVGSQNYKAVRDFSMDGHLMLLTGTPLSKIEDGYAYVKLVSPETYRNLNHFCNLHVTKRDFFNKPIEYGNLDLLEKNLRINSVRILKEDVLDRLPEIQYIPMEYDLAPAHYALYTKLVNEQLLELDDGSKIDATEATRLWHNSQQIIINYSHFSGHTEDEPAGFELMDEVLDELGDEKLIVVANYRLSVKAIMAHLAKRKIKAVQLNGDVPNKRQAERNVDQFTDDPKTRVIVIQPEAGGYGLNLQDVCSNIMMMEVPLTPIQWEQVIGRVYRNGQTKKVNIRIAVAGGTIQVTRLHDLMHKDHLVNRVMRNYQDIKDALFGKV